MQQRVISALLAKCKISAGTGILLGVSGGPDSMCLLDILSKTDYPILVAHLDHALRSESSDDASFVQMFCESRSLPFVRERIDAAAYSHENKLSIEEAARILRYRFLFRQARNHHMGAVAVAHNADDQVETILMHFLRGSGISGLKGMEYHSIIPEWDTEIPLIRPLLDCWRGEILTYCESQNLHPLLDASNNSLLYQRNRIRHSLIPELETYNPGFRQRIVNMASVLQDDHQLLHDWVEDTLEHVIVNQGNGFVEFSRPVLQTFSKGELRRLLRYATFMIKPTLRDLNYEALDRTAEYALNPHTDKKVELVEGITISSERDRLILQDNRYTLPEGDYPQIGSGCFSISIPGVLEFDNGWQLFSEWEEWASKDGEYRGEQSNWHVRIDSAVCEFPLIVRTAKPGERIKPLGMNDASMKLSDLLINQKIPRRWRGGYPIIYSGNQVVWAPGLRLAHPYRCTPSTQKVVHLWFSKPD